MDLDQWVLAVVVLGLAFEYVNGFHDAANAIATSVLTRAMTIRSAVFLCALLNFAGAMMSKKVAETMGKGLVDPANVTGRVVVAALLGAIIWDLITWVYGLPTSSTHAIVGGVIGAVAGSSGLQVLHWAGTRRVFLALVLSPVAGIVVSTVVMIAFLWLFGHRPPKTVNRRFRLIQVASAGFMALSHGSNDGQKTMGIIALALFSAGAGAHAGAQFHIPLWVMVSCAAAMALGSGAGGWRIIKTVGRKVMELQPIHGCVAEFSAATIILTASHLGAPISTTHTISSTIMGVGMSRRLSAVRWRVVANVVMAWIMTLPAAALLSFGCVKILQHF